MVITIGCGVGVMLESGWEYKHVEEVLQWDKLEQAKPERAADKTKAARNGRRIARKRGKLQ